MIDQTENKEQKQVDEVLQEWSQGDYVLGEEWFVYRFNSQLPLTDEAKDLALESTNLVKVFPLFFIWAIEAKDLASESTNLVESEVRGLVVVTQTCDLVRGVF